MTPEAMRIAIAESEGWKQQTEHGIYWNEALKRALIAPGSQLHQARLDMNLKCEPNIQILPNYPEDLNAILPLLPKQVVIINDSNCWRVIAGAGELETFNPSLALAACEFYLKWKGLWKE